VVVQLDARRRKPMAGRTSGSQSRRGHRRAKLASIATDLYDAISADDRSRGEYLAIRARGLGLLGTKLEEPKVAAVDSSSGRRHVDRHQSAAARGRAQGLGQCAGRTAARLRSGQDQGRRRRNASEDDLADPSSAT
jgi:hypothetical protein